jgi:hypothetical protein
VRLGLEGITGVLAVLLDDGVLVGAGSTSDGDGGESADGGDQSEAKHDGGLYNATAAGLAGNHPPDFTGWGGAPSRG